MVLKDGAHANAKWAIRHYREIRDSIGKIEQNRPVLVSRIKNDSITHEPLPVKYQPLAEVAADREVVTTYVEGRIIIQVLRTVLSERMRSRDANIMEDLCVRGLNISETARENGVSESTVKRARLRMEQAYADEVQSRNAAESQKAGYVKTDP